MITQATLNRVLTARNALDEVITEAFTSLMVELEAEDISEESNVQLVSDLGLVEEEIEGLKADLRLNRAEWARIKCRLALGRGEVEA